MKIRKFNESSSEINRTPSYIEEIEDMFADIKEMGYDVNISINNDIDDEENDWVCSYSIELTDKESNFTGTGNPYSLDDLGDDLVEKLSNKIESFGSRYKNYCDQFSNVISRIVEAGFKISHINFSHSTAMITIISEEWINFNQ